MKEPSQSLFFDPFLSSKAVVPEAPRSGPLLCLTRFGPSLKPAVINVLKIGWLTARRAE